MELRMIVLVELLFGFIFILPRLNIWSNTYVLE